MNFIRNEKFLQMELASLQHDTTASANKETQQSIQKIIQLCEQLKKAIVVSATEGADMAQLEKGESVIGDRSFQDTYYNVQGLSTQSKDLQSKINAFNTAYPQEIIDVKGMFFDDTDTHYIRNINILMALEQLIQVERMVLFSEQHLVAGK
jgi:hypothetical protein